MPEFAAGMPILKRALLGTPLSNQNASHSLLPKWIALPVFCSDPLSSVAYATQEILLVLVLGGLTALAWTPWVGLAVSALLIVVVLSYQKTVHAYPDGGGAYAVSKANFGQGTALVAASALIVDYILTVAVSVTAGVDNIISAIPAASPYAVGMSVVIIVLLTVMNLRGVKESGKSFAAPTYFFIATVLLMLAVALVKALLGSPVRAESADLPVHGTSVAGMAAVLLLLRAFASGCTALTGVEAVSNGVPFFRAPKSTNAAKTLLVMGSLAVVLFGGVTALAVTSGVRISENPMDIGLPAGAVQQTVIAQLGSATFGAGSVGFFALQLFTMAVLVLAANTAYNSFPILAAVLGRDGYMPRQFSRRGDRLVFSNGILVLAACAILLVIAFDASVTRLIQLYILGVFLSFTLSQAGMVRHWTRLLRNPLTTGKPSIRRARILNAVGAMVTSVVLVIVVVTKFSHGAWMVILAVPVFLVLMVAIKRHYRATDRRLAAAPGGVTLPSRVHGIVLVSRLHAPTIQALAYARATRPSTLVAVHVQTDGSDVESLEREWLDRAIPVPLIILDSPYRDITGVFIDYVHRISRDSPHDIVSVFIPEYVVRHPWETLLHNQSALRLRVRLRSERGVVVTSVPVQMRDYVDLPSDKITEVV